MLATWITLARLPLLALCLTVLYLGSPALRLAGAALLLVGLLLDTVDGLVARARGESSLAGSVLDIAADRIYELALWTAFAHLGLVSPAIPLLVLGRTTLTDALRSVGVAAGTAPFDQPRGRLARFLVASAWMRTTYAVMKVAVFCGLALVHAALDLPAGSSWRSLAPAALELLRGLAWLLVGLCLLRGVPVLWDGLRRLAPPDGLRRRLSGRPGPAGRAG